MNPIESKNIQRNEILYTFINAIHVCETSKQAIQSVIADLCSYLEGKRAYLIQQNNSACLFEYSPDRPLKDIDFSVQYDLVKNSKIILYTQSIYPEKIQKEQEIIADDTIKAILTIPLHTSHFDGCLNFNFQDEIAPCHEEFAWLNAIKNLINHLLTTIYLKEEKNSLKINDLLNNIAQEIRVPLNSVISYSELLAVTDESDERQEYLNIMNVYNQQLIRFTDNATDLNKLQLNDIRLYEQPCYLNEILNNIEKNTIHRLDDTDILFTITPEETQCELLIDHKRLSQIIYNIVDFCISATTKGHITISYEIQDEIIIRIQNEGCDFKQNYVENLINHEQLSVNEMSHIRLSISKHLTELMQGKLSISSNENHTTFEISLPADKLVAMEKADAKSKGENAVPSSDEPLILIAEDNEFNYKLIDIILREHAHVHAWNGSEAVNMFKKMHPKLVLMDLKMPVMDGYEATRLIREISPSIPIIAITAFTDNRSKILQSGFTSYISKPIDTKNLLKEIEEYIKNETA